jgi:hypothetical protein
MSKLFGFIDKRPLIWFHYVLLTIVLFGLHELSMFLGLESPDKIIELFIFYVIGLGIGDQLIHYFLGVD